MILRATSPGCCELYHNTCIRPGSDKISDSDESATRGQHRGLGQKLMAATERIARARGADRIADISGIGAREYYRKMGYTLQGTYMIKVLVPHDRSE